MPSFISDFEEEDVESPSYVSITDYNRRISWFREVSLVTIVRRALIYEINSTRPRVILLPARDEWDPACGVPVSSYDLDTHQWFGRQPITSSIYAFPGTRCRLRNSFDIITLRSGSVHGTNTINRTIERLFNTECMGNLIVVKRGRYEYDRAVNVTPSEVSLINALVERWLQLRNEPDSDDEV